MRTSGSVYRTFLAAKTRYFTKKYRRAGDHWPCYKPWPVKWNKTHASAEETKKNNVSRQNKNKSCDIALKKEVDCSAASNFFGVLSEIKFRQCVFWAQQCHERERNRGSVYESACYGFITKQRALEALSALGRLFVPQPKSLRYLARQFHHTHWQTDKQLPISPLGYVGVSIKSSCSSVLSVSLDRNRGAQEAVTISHLLKTLAFIQTLKLMGLCPVPPLWLCKGTDCQPLLTGSQCGSDC